MIKKTWRLCLLAAVIGIVPSVLVTGCGAGGPGVGTAIPASPTAGTYRTNVALGAGSGVLTIVVGANGSATATITPGTAGASALPVNVSLDPETGAFTVVGTVVVNGVSYDLNLNGVVNTANGGSVTGTVNGQPFNGTFTVTGTGSGGSA